MWEEPSERGWYFGLSCDVHAHKVGLIENGAARLGLTNITARQQDATDFVPEWENAMDAVIADVPCSGLGIIQNGAERLGLTNIEARQQDATVRVPEWEETMDVVIADVPCSGLGIIRKKPDIRYKNLEELKGLPELQLAILENQSRYVKPGGVLIYSTCTVLKAENEEVVSAFLEKHKDYTLEPLELPDVFPKNETGMLTLIPGQYDTDGFFISRLRRNV